MKLRNFAALTGIAIAFAATAAPVTPEEALRRATIDIAAPRAVRAAVSAAPVLIKTTTSESGTPAVYLFSSRDNFVMLPADDIAAPVLGYGDTAIDPEAELPANLAWWLSEYSREIEYAASQPQLPRVTLAGERATNRASIAPMLTCKWDQSTPYNNDCPTVSGKLAVTGCMATAMAQIMYYHKYPAAGVGSVSYTDSFKNKYSMTFGPFDWANMLDTYPKQGYNEVQASAVAYLMKSCGYAAKMAYSPNGSGASTPNAVQALKENFKYNPNLYSIDRSYFGIEEWETKIYNNLRDCGPVLYTGANYEGNEGHAFVCDGYSTDGYFHFNWGWSGMCDGYFRLTALVPDAVGIGGGSGGGFNFYQEVVLGISAETRPAPEANMQQGGDLVLTLENNALYLECENGLNNGFFNTTGAPITGQVGIMIEYSNGEQKYYWNNKKSEINNMSGYSKYGISCPILSAGVYKVYPAFKLDGAAEGKRMEQQIGTVTYGYLTVSTSGKTVSMPQGASLSVSNVSIPSGLYVGRLFHVNADLTNNGNMEFYGPIGVGLARTSGTQLSLAAYGSIELIDLLEGESTAKSFISTFTGTVTAGEYTLIIFHPETGTVYYSQKCTVNADPGAPALSCADFSIAGNASNVNPNDITFNATVDCTSGYFSDYLMVYIYQPEGRVLSYVTSVNSPAPLFLNKGDRASVTIPLNFENAVKGVTYTCWLYYIDSTYQLVDLGRLEFTAGEGESGLEDVSADINDTPAEYFDLMGRRVANPSHGNFYLRRTADKVEKIIF